MKITLYKKCILSNSYSEVFDVFHKTKDPLTNEETVALQRYLSSLTKYEITADNVYVPNSGKITLELDFDYENVSNNIYEYNYMYLEDTDNNFRRYCFIDDITVVNGLAVISFSEDIWSNYASSMEIRKSLLVRSRATKYGDWSIPFYAPGMAYEGNNPLKINTMLNVPISTDNPSAMNILCQLQTYTLSEQGVISDRQVYTSIVSYAETVQPSNTRKLFFDFKAEPATGDYSATEVVQGLYKLSSTTKLNGTQKYFQISNVLLIPNYLSEIISKNEIGVVQHVIVSNGDLECVFCEIDISGTKKGELYFLQEYNINNDFTLLGVGTINRIIPIAPNGNKIKVSFGISYDNFSVALFLSVQNQLYEITEDYACEVPISVQTADVTQQQASVRELRDLNAKLGIASGSLGIMNGVMETAIGWSTVGLGMALGNVVDAAPFAGTETVHKGFSGVFNGMARTGDGILGIIGSNKELEIANRKMFTTNKGISVKQNTLINGVKDLLLYYIDANNAKEVQANIDNTGYVCNEIVDDLFNKPITDEVATAYNVMRFDFANVFGNFTQKIAKALRAILYSGFKIWYDETQINV